MFGEVSLTGGIEKETVKEAARARERQEPVLYHLTGDLYSAIR